MSDAHPDVCHPPYCSMGDFYIAIDEDRERDCVGGAGETILQ